MDPFRLPSRQVRRSQNGDVGKLFRPVPETPLDAAERRHPLKLGSAFGGADERYGLPSGASLLERRLHEIVENLQCCAAEEGDYLCQVEQTQPLPAVHT